MKSKRCILKNFPIKPKISPHIHKNVLLKRIKVLIAKSITITFSFPQTALILLDMKLAWVNKNENSLYYFTRNAHFIVVALHIIVYYLTTYTECDFGCKHFEFLPNTNRAA